MDFIENKLDPFEIHLSFQFEQNDYPKFMEICQKIQAKVLEIVLARGHCPKQIMCSKIIFAESLDQVLLKIQPYSQIFEQANFQIQRIKIETSILENITETPTKYFEWHGQIEYKAIEQLVLLCTQHRVHLSYNALKNKENYRYITLREYEGRQRFLDRLVTLKSALKEQQRCIVKEISECCIYDSNEKLDLGWLN